MVVSLSFLPLPQQTDPEPEIRGDEKSELITFNSRTDGILQHVFSGKSFLVC